MRFGSLFSGYGGLEQGVQSVLGGTVAWHSEIDPGACKILAHRYPDVPNLGDITAVDWSAVEPVDVLTAGYPCQPFSAAGKRQGTEDVRHLWPYVAHALGHLRPEWCLLENVRGHLTLGFDQVLRDLDLLHYEARWVVLRAADVGAPHGRARIFILGRNRGSQLRRRPDRRRGLHRDSGGGWLDAASVEDRHDGQGDAESDRDAPGLRRQAGRGQAGRGADAGVACVAPERSESCRPDRAVAVEAAHESGAGPDRAGVPADDRCSAEAGKPLGGLERRDASAGAGLPGTHPGGESPRTGCATAGSTPGATAGSPAIRGVVGAGRGSVRPGGVHGTIPDVGNDDRGTHLPAGCGAACVCGAALVARDASSPARRGSKLRDLRARSIPAAEPGEPAGATPPHPADDGRERGRPARHGRHGSADHGDAARANAAGLGRGPSRRDDGVRSAGLVTVDWGQYEPAIRRWERLTRSAPSPTELSAKGSPRLSPAFVEFMMGLPAGWVTDVPGLTRNEQLKALGNGVVPQQAAHALRLLLGDVAVAA